MDPAKHAPPQEPRAPWAGPRAVLRAGTDSRFHKEGGVQAALDEGFDGVEWMATGGPEPVRGDVAAKSAPTRARGAVALELCTTDVELAIHQTDELLDRARGLRATCLTLTLPPVVTVESNGPGEGPTTTFTHYQDQLNFAFQLLHRARFAAERNGVPMALEAATGGGLLSPVELREIIDEANSPSIGACIDTARLAPVGSPIDWFETLSHRVHAVRITDPARNNGLVDVLARSGFDRTVILDGATLLPSIRSMFDART